MLVGLLCSYNRCLLIALGVEQELIDEMGGMDAHEHEASLPSSRPLSLFVSLSLSLSPSSLSLSLTPSLFSPPCFPLSSRPPLPWAGLPGILVAGRQSKGRGGAPGLLCFILGLKPGSIDATRVRQCECWRQSLPVRRPVTAIPPCGGLVGW